MLTPSYKKKDVNACMEVIMNQHARLIIASDLVKLNDIKNFISNCKKITRFFYNSHQSIAILQQGFKDMKINMEGLQTWCKTRWGSLFITTDSILRTRLSLDMLGHGQPKKALDIKNVQHWTSIVGAKNRGRQRKLRGKKKKNTNNKTANDLIIDNNDD
ncbi:hypothetical protein Glove_692g3 [Diversispora epigaea]|uniref:Uncharacterized protein n=1 Tax=Diversispora epigaea TaxID=1348612 RepID=A0A397G5B3_9GLOM|nr:hypothetical protein Glove_692g3 [Diversispora epigaea]